MGLLNSFFIILITTQMSLAGEAVIQSYSASLKKWDKEFKQTFHQLVTLEMNKLLSRPDELKKRINKNSKFSPKDLQLFNKDFSKIDDSLLRQARVKLKGGKHIISIPKLKNLVFDLAMLPKGYITIDGQSFPIQDLYDYQKVQEFFYKKYAAKKTWHNFILPSAYAVLPALAGLAPILGLAIAETVISVFTISREWERINKKLGEYEQYFRNALHECDSDKSDILDESLSSSRPMSNNTLVFMREIEVYSKYNVHRIEKKDDDSFLSCKNIKQNQGVWFRTQMFKVPLFKTAGSMCKAAELLQRCLDEVKESTKERGLSINHKGRYQNLKETSYDNLIESFSESVLK